MKYRHVIKLLINFERTVPVLFLYMSPNTGTKVRELLGMQDPKGPYYDPVGQAEMHRRITLLLDKLPKDSKAIVTSLFLQEDKIDELTAKEANNIFIRATRTLWDHSLITTWKLNQNLTTMNTTDTISVNDDVQTIITYPSFPVERGITINTAHYLCLAEGQYLNDAVIEFYLKYLTLEVLSEFDQHRTHVFSSFFYQRLITPHFGETQNTVPITLAAERHARVQRWTKDVNIFEKDFVIIPINKNEHWFLAIICFPGLVGKVSKRITKTSKNYSLVSFSNTGGDSSESVQKNKKIKTLKRKAVELEEQKEIKIPCILIFDSLGGANYSSVFTTLRDYLSCEYVVKFGVEKTFSKDTIKGAYPKVPRQSNYTDCGLYLLQYVESFFKDPIKDYTLPIKILETWFEEMVILRKREELSNLIIKLMNNTKGNKPINLPTITFPTKNGKLKRDVKNQM
ncbi:Sentrin-specific protease 7 [Trachymyrmex cornetzi]|uniref:Sentrin-specific protease 7 n=2 Tax=Trachymyrmex cornetzi TaxID=471704 RepID=A0A195DQB8_9HYME|nr:Sentrin-specific protease 7 [Trachymyrmex cornetzi]